MRSFVTLILFAWSAYGACPSLLNDATTIANALQSLYRPSGQNGYVGGSAWTDANAVEDLNNLMLAAGTDTYSTVIDTIFSQVENQLETGGSFDDVQWVALTYWKVCDYLHARGKDITNCMARADKFYQIAASAYDSTVCGGGVWWSGARDYKNAITNELFILTSAQYYLRTGNQTYLNNAKNTWAWLKSTNMKNGNGLYNDGLTSQCTNNGQTTWTYNQAVIASALGNLAVATGDKSLFTEAQVSIDATIKLMETNNILRESCDDATGAKKCDADQQIFKGLFTKHLQYLIDTANDPVITAKYKGFLQAQASAVIHYGKRADNAIGSVWYAPDQGGSSFTPKTQASGLAALIATAKYGDCP